MSTFFRLTKFQLKYYLRPFNASSTRKEKTKYILTLVGIGVCFLLPIAMIIMAVYMGSGYAAKQGLLPELLSALFASTEIATIFLGTATYVNIMYFSRDNALLMAMPIKTTHIYMSKLIVCLVSMMSLSSLILIPALIAAAVGISKAGVVLGASYYILAIMGLITTPLIALMIISILAFPVMKIVSFLKKRPVLLSVVSVTFALGIMAAVISLEALIGAGTGDDIMNVVEGVASLGKYSYATLVLARAMMGIETIVNISIHAGICIGSLLLGMLLSLLLYKSTMARMDEGGMAAQSETRAKKTKANSPLMALMKRDIKVVMRSPDLFIQTIMMVVMAPILIVIFAWIEQQAPMEEEGGNTALFFASMVYFYECIMMGMNYLASIGISRERDALSILKVMPVSTGDIIKAKMLIADAVTILATTICTITYVICSKDAPWYSAIFMLITSSVIGISLNAFALYRDAKKPNLRWMNVREITKNNFGAIVPMLIAMASGMVMSMIAGALSFGGLSSDVAFLIFWGIVTVIAIVFFMVFRWRRKAKIVALYDAIEG